MIEVKHLSKIYGSTVAIKDVDFSVETGEILGFLGPNGAGKTTTMRILSGYLPATTGTAIIDGYDVHQQSMEVRKRIGYLPETPPLYLDMTVESFLNFVARIKGVSAGDRAARIDYALKNCQLEDKRKVLIHKLSKGYKQRVGIAQAIVHDPPAIILDEPTVGLDPKQIIEVRHLIKNLAGQHTIILSTHILPEVSMTCDRVTIINKGKVLATDTPDNLMSDLKGSSGYKIEVFGELNTIKTELEKLADITQVKTESLNNNPNHNYLLISTKDDKIGGEVARIIVNHGLDLWEMKRTKPTLEDVFLDLITEEATPESLENLALETSELNNSELENSTEDN
jgi:ABC-2 type transport system ATP-binding protein